MNYERIGRGLATINQYQDGLDEVQSTDVAVLLVDMLTDLRHTCKRLGVDFDGSVRMSASHFKAEE